MIETTNEFLVATAPPRFGEGVILLNPPARAQRLTKEQALRLAAWLVAIADDDGTAFVPVLDAVRDT